MTRGAAHDAAVHRADLPIAKILVDIEAGDGVQTAVIANDVPWSSWSLWTKAEPELRAQCRRARERGNARLRAEVLETDDPVKAKVRLHLLACRCPAWAETKRMNVSGNISLCGLLAQADKLANAGEGDDDDGSGDTG